MTKKTDVVESTGTFLSKFVLNELTPVSKATLNPYRSSLIEAIKVVIERLCDQEEENELNKQEIPLRTDDEILAFKLMSLLNLISLFQESTSHYTSQDSQLTDEQVKANTILNARLNTASFYLKIFNQFHQQSKHEPPSEELIPSDDLLTLTPGKTSSRDRELILEIFYTSKRICFRTKLSKKQKQRDGSRLQQLTKAHLKIQDVSLTWPYETKKSGIVSDDKLIDLIAVQNSRTFSDQRFEISEKKERTMALNDVLHLVEKMNHSRLDDQAAMSREQRDAENFEKVEEAIERASHSRMDNQRYTLSPSKIKELSLNELVHTVEKLTNQRMRDQDAPSPEERKKEMLNVIADVVEKMRSSSLDDQRFIAKVAPKMNMTASQLNKSIESLPLSESSSVHSSSRLFSN